MVSGSWRDERRAIASMGTTEWRVGDGRQARESAMKTAYSGSRKRLSEAVGNHVGGGAVHEAKRVVGDDLLAEPVITTGIEVLHARSGGRSLGNLDACFVVLEHGGRTRLRQVEIA
jgi:hypothetical protein